MIGSPYERGGRKGKKHMKSKQFVQIVAVTLLTPLALACDEHSEHEASAEGTAEAPAVAAAETETESRVAVEVGSRGYDPSRVQATAGTPLTLVFTRTTDKGCGDELVIADHDIKRDLPLDEPVEVTFTPTETGEIKFTCGMGMYDGKVVVR
jgi:plastocyanin domain-containing protein